MPGEHEWGIGYLWRWTNRLERLDILVLALMLLYSFAVVIQLLYRYHPTGVAKGIVTSGQNPRKLAPERSVFIRNLNSIASVAPYLGLLGTCLGLLSLFGGFAMAKWAVVVMISTETAAALLSTGAGILVAITATCLHNFLVTRIDLLESGLPSVPLTPAGAYPHQNRKLPLTKRFSEVPPFGLIAALGLALLVPGFMSFGSFGSPKGFGVEIGSPDCESDVLNRSIVLHITNAGEVFLNTDRQDWTTLAGRLSEIYSTRVQHTLYLFADDGVPFQKVADAIEIVRNTPVTVGSRSLDITVRLTTLKAINSRCPEPVF